jgi:hypothetical protein
VTFDHLVPPHDGDPDTLQISIAETEYDQAGYLKDVYRGQADPGYYAPYRKRVGAIHQCCSIREGTADRWRINASVQIRETEIREKTGRFTMLLNVLRRR